MDLTPTNAELSKFLDAQQSDSYSTRLLFQLAAKRLRAADNFAQVAIETVFSARVLISKGEEGANHWRNFYAARFQDALDQYQRGDDQ